ncbi:hypothetical protein [Bradyrhizobium neotropicale]|uniref:hypothetical protein n=1 Tax=Bradyrhizobium neotropicale TaxID=1497615 RepID=UPI001AD7A8C1|nr:hypothetical protein [Bradyrhizobium neotropicale]MBO4228003.1 hypothetical protein [Bradyrhizobium neotropicale]
MDFSWLHIAIAGIWPLIGYFGAGGTLLVGLLAAAWFSPVFKKEFLWAAGVVGAFMIAFTMGVVTGEKHVRAQWDAANAVAIDKANKAQADAVRTVRRKPSRWLPAHRDADCRDC